MRILGCEISKNECNNVHLIRVHNYNDRKYAVWIKDSEFDASRLGCGIFSSDSGLNIVSCSLRNNNLGIHCVQILPD